MINKQGTQGTQGTMCKSRTNKWTNGTKLVYRYNTHGCIETWFCYLVKRIWNIINLLLLGDGVKVNTQSFKFDDIKPEKKTIFIFISGAAAAVLCFPLTPPSPDPLSSLHLINSRLCLFISTALYERVSPHLFACHFTSKQRDNGYII